MELGTPPAWTCDATTENDEEARTGERRLKAGIAKRGGSPWASNDGRALPHSGLGISKGALGLPNKPKEAPMPKMQLHLIVKGLVGLSNFLEFVTN